MLWNMNGLWLSIQLGISWSRLTPSFFRGLGQPLTRLYPHYIPTIVKMFVSIQPRRRPSPVATGHPAAAPPVVRPWRWRRRWEILFPLGFWTNSECDHQIDHVYLMYIYMYIYIILYRWIVVSNGWKWLLIVVNYHDLTVLPHWNPY